MKRVLLIDADIIAYRASAAHQDVIDWGDGVTSVDARIDGAKQAADNDIAFFKEQLKADDIIVCLSDDVVNFRKRIDPTYKQARGNTERPIHLYDIKDHLAETYPTVLFPTLEADDVMGILATTPTQNPKDELIIVSMDKDMMTIPVKVCRPKVDPKKPGGLDLKIMDITPLEAIRFHFWQTVVGDTIDGYPGCPGIGPDSVDAQNILEAEDELEAWDHVLTAFGSKGLTEEDAVRQARLAFILRNGYYENGKPLFWNPPYCPDYESAN